MNIKDKYVTEFPVAIVGDGTGITTTTTATMDGTSSVVVQEATASVEVEGAAASSSSSAAAGDDESSSTKDIVANDVVVIQPTCVVTLRITYLPSPKDQREELYELLNKTSLRKAEALENLRIISLEMAASRSAATAGVGGGDGPEDGADPSSGGSSEPNKPTVRPGFLNAKSSKKKEPEESRFMKFYTRTLGPDSIVRKGASLALFLKDYIIFFGAVTFFHYQGQMLALPPPV
jgi:hypothetical protein